MVDRSPPANHVIDVVVKGDLAEIALIERSLFSDPWPASGFDDLLAIHGAFVRCVRESADGRILGYVVAWFVADEGQIANLAVRADAQRRGVGATLLDATLAAAIEHAATSVYLEVRSSNAAARRLYAGRGFEEMGTRRGYYRAPVEDAIMLRRVISASMQ